MRTAVGVHVGIKRDPDVEAKLGAKVGAHVGIKLGGDVGAKLGAMVGVYVGIKLGVDVGGKVGANVANVGDKVGKRRPRPRATLNPAA